MTNNNKISLNFLELTQKNFDAPFDVPFYAKLLDTLPEEEHNSFFIQSLREKDEEKYRKYAITFEKQNGFEYKVLSSSANFSVAENFILFLLQKHLKTKGISPCVVKKNKYKRCYLPLTEHIEGTETIWLEPYFLKSSNSFGILIDYKFWVNEDYKERIQGSVDKKILQLSGALDNKGYSNKAFYLFKYEKINLFMKKYYHDLSQIGDNGTIFSLSNEFNMLDNHTLNRKTYLFGENKDSQSAYMGLQKYGPLKSPDKQTEYLFVFKETDRNIAINLWKGLQGTTFKNTFSGMESFFKIQYNNSCIQGKKVPEYTEQIFEDIAAECLEHKKQGINLIPIILTNSKISDADDKLYYMIKYIYTKLGIPCQVVTKDLVNNPNSLKYSLSNIGLQIFAKVGGKPWKVKPALKECLIIGIGNKNKIVLITDNNGNKQRKIEKYLTYSVLTDSSGLFKELQILCETDNEEDYYQSLIEKFQIILNQAIADGYKDIVIHAPFKISKTKVWSNVFRDIAPNINISILQINSKHKFFGYDFSKNALVPYESSYVAISKNEYLVWFEGLQYNNAAFTKLIGAPVYINFWHSNKSELLQGVEYRKSLLQDCISLSGANWKGFRAKQLPVSIFYCQTIAEFLKKFEDYGFEQVKFENMQPWFL
jgi:hypothetical protein